MLKGKPKKHFCGVPIPILREATAERFRVLVEIGSRVVGSSGVGFARMCLLLLGISLELALEGTLKERKRKRKRER